MKKFKFKLEALLKLRRFKEEQARVQIGMMRTELEKLKERINEARDHIQTAAESQIQVMRSGAKARNIQFYPDFFQGKETDIKQMMNNTLILQKAIEAKVEEWKVLRGEVKVIEKLKNKKQTEYKKAYNKDEAKKLEEMVQLWDQSVG